MDIDPKTGKKIEYPAEYEEGKAVFDQDGTVADVDDLDDTVVKDILNEID